MNPVAQTPPMGWNSWDCFETRVTEQDLYDNAKVVAERLAAYGYRYVVCDIQWSAPPTPPETRGYRPFVPLSLDAYGRQQPDETRFPSSAGGMGFTTIAERIHGMGLLLGIHIMRGVPRQAVHARLPVLGADATCADIADPASISRWNGDMYGVCASAAGQAYYNALFEQYAAWGVDFIKVDDIANTNAYPHAPYSAKAEIEMIARAVRACGRPMVVSLSPGPAPIDQSWHLRTHANMWRITDDFWDNWRLLKDMFRRCEVWEGVARPGAWPDCDMLPLGVVGGGHGVARPCALNREEQFTLMTLWCVARSPLIMGGDLSRLDAFTLELLTNKRALSLNQQGETPRQLYRTDTEAAWLARDAHGACLALFNLSDEPRAVSSDIPERCAIELWGRQDRVSCSNTARLPAHGCALLAEHTAE